MNETTIALPTRREYEYIEKFEKFEFTHCFTYELARRNPNVEKSLNLLFDLFFYYEQEILPMLVKFQAVTITKDMLEPIKDVEKIYKDFMIGLVNHYEKYQFEDDFEDLTLSNTKEKISYLVQALVKELYEKYYVIYQHETEELSHDFHDIYNPLKYLERDRTLTEHIEGLSDSEIDLREYYKFNETENEYFTIYQSIYNYQKEFSFNTIYPNFRTAMRDFTDTKVLLNLNLPLEEIKDYIKKIKEEHNKKNSIIKSPRELLEEKLEIEDDTIGVIISKKWADVFFIYDYFYISKLLTNKKDYEIRKEIQLELTKYHGVKVLKEDYEIKNKKDTKYKIVPWHDFLKDNPDVNESNIDFEEVDTEKAHNSLKDIENKYDQLESYIVGDNPKYKNLIHR